MVMDHGGQASKGDWHLGNAGQDSVDVVLERDIRADIPRHRECASNLTNCNEFAIGIHDGVLLGRAFAIAVPAEHGTEPA